MNSISNSLKGINLIDNQKKIFNSFLKELEILFESGRLHFALDRINEYEKSTFIKRSNKLQLQLLKGNIYWLLKDFTKAERIIVNDISTTKSTGSNSLSSLLTFELKFLQTRIYIEKSRYYSERNKLTEAEMLIATIEPLISQQLVVKVDNLLDQQLVSEAEKLINKDRRNKEESLKIAHINLLKGWFYLAKSLYPESYSYLTKALKYYSLLQRNDFSNTNLSNVDFWIIITNIILSKTTFEMGKRKDGTDKDSYTYANEGRQKNLMITQNVYLEMDLLKQIASINDIIGQYTEALKTTEELQILANNYTIKDYNLSVKTLKGIIHCHTGEVDTSIEYLKDALRLASNPDIVKEVINISRYLMRAYRLKGDLEAVKKYYNITQTKAMEFNDTFTGAAAIVEMFLAYIENNKIQEARKLRDDAVNMLRGVSSGLVENPLFRQAITMSEAILLKQSQEIEDQLNSIKKFKEVIDEGIVSIEITEIALLNLFELLISKLGIEEEGSERQKDILNQLKILTVKIKDISEKQNSVHLRVKGQILDSELALLELKTSRAQELLIQARNGARDNGMIAISQWIKDIQEKVINQFIKLYVLHITIGMKEIIRTTAPMIAKINNGKIDEIKEKPETPEFLSIASSIDNLPFYSYKFGDTGPSNGIDVKSIALVAIDQYFVLEQHDDRTFSITNWNNTTLLRLKYNQPITNQINRELKIFYIYNGSSSEAMDRILKYKNKLSESAQFISCFPNDPNEPIKEEIPEKSDWMMKIIESIWG